MNAQNSLIVGMVKLKKIKITQPCIIGGAILKQVLVLLKMVFHMGSIIKLLTLLQIKMWSLDMYIHHFGDSRYINYFFFPIVTVFITFKLIMLPVYLWGVFLLKLWWHKALLVEKIEARSEAWQHAHFCLLEPEIPKSLFINVGKRHNYLCNKILQCCI